MDHHDDDADARSLAGTKRCGREMCGSRDDAAWRVLSAELVGAALLVLLTCLAGCGAAAQAAPLFRAFASGLIVIVLVQSVDHVSGAMFNPTVTLAALLWGRVSAARAAGMLAAQLAGATAGGALLALLQPQGAALCVTLPQPGLSLYKAVVIEGVLGGCLALVNCGTWDARTTHLRDSWPLRIGLVVAALSLVGGELTGASMNPVRSFAPALWSGNWRAHWVYWAGPLGGSLVFTSLYCAAWRARQAPPAPSPAGQASPSPSSSPRTHKRSAILP